MRAYQRLGDHDKLIHMVDVDMAARYPRVPTAGYRNAMMHLARIVERSKSLAPGTAARRRVQAKIDEYWAHIQRRGEDMAFESLLARVETLTSLGQLSDAERVYRRGVVALRRDKHPGALHLTGAMFFAYCVRGRVGDAQKLLDGVRDVDVVPASSASSASASAAATAAQERARAFRPFVTGCIAAQASYDTKRRLLTQVLRLAKDLAPALWGLVLQFYLQGSGGRDVAGTCAVFATKATGVASQWWYNVLSGLLRDGAKATTPVPALRAGVHILSELFPRDATASPFRTLAAWTVVQGAIARSVVLPERERHDMLEQTMAALPERLVRGYEATLRARTMLIALQRPDRTGTPEALHQWRRVRGTAPPSLFVALMGQLLRLGHKSTARDVAADIPFEPRFRPALAYALHRGLYAGVLPDSRHARAVEVDRSAPVDAERDVDPDEDEDAREDDDDDDVREEL